MKTYRDLPASLKTEDGADVFIHGYIHQAKTDEMVDTNQRFTEKLLSQTVALCAEKCEAEFVLGWLRAAVQLYESKVRVEGGASTNG